MGFVEKHKSKANSLFLAAACLWIGTAAQMGIETKCNDEKSQVAKVKAMNDKDRVSFLANKVEAEFGHLIPRGNHERN